MIIYLSVFLFAILDIGLILKISTTIDISENLTGLDFIIAAIVYMLSFNLQNAEVV
jgi:hypothetical protein